MSRDPNHSILVMAVAIVIAACASPAAESTWTHAPLVSVLPEPSGPTSSATSTPRPDASQGPTADQPRVIALKETAALSITSDDQPVSSIAVTPGETVRFLVTNAAGFDHDLYIGPDQQLAANRVSGLAGLPTASDDQPRSFDWTVPADVTGLSFGCTLRGHYPTMHGTFSTN